MFYIFIQRISQVLFCLVIFITIASAQKRDIDSTTFYTWPKLSSPLISPDGRHTIYCIENSPVGSFTIIVKSIHSHWELKVICSNANFYAAKLDNKRAYFVCGKDSLAIVDLEKSIKYYTGVSIFKLSNHDENNVLAGLSGSKLNVIRDGINTIIDDVVDYKFALNGDFIILKIKNNIDGQSSNKIVLFDLRNMAKVDLWKGVQAEKLIINSALNKIAFISTDPLKGITSNKIIIIDLLSRKLNTIEDNPDSCFYVSDLMYFGKKDNNLFVKLNEVANLSDKENDLNLKVWSYNDDKIQSEQINELSDNSYVATVNLKQNKTIRLQEDKEYWLTSISPDNNYDFCLVPKFDGDCYLAERRWNGACKVNWCLVNTLDGSRNYISNLPNNPGINYILSPEGRYILFYDEIAKSYFSYSIEDTVTVDITKGILSHSQTKNYSGDESYIPMAQRGVAGWMENDNSVLIYDDNDIWLVDPKGIEPSQNLTRSYGSSNNIVFSLLDNSQNIIKSKRSIILVGFNTQNKQNGFYTLSLDSKYPPRLLTMGSYIYYLPFGGVFESHGMKPVKGKNSNTYIVRRESCKEFPNFFVTRDFKTFKSLTDIHPEKEFNWINSELHTWKLPDGKIIQGILYKPEFFDSSKRYPLIFNVYERFSNSLNSYIPPEPLNSGCTINPTSAIGEGYLVFMPDIYFKFDRAGESALTTVNSAISHLSKYNYIDSVNLGIQGCSFGGYETNYIATHSNGFKAICTASGLSDLVSYSSDFCEIVYTESNLGQLRIKRMIWEDPSVIIENSPIFNVKDITSPLLLLHTKNDSGIKLSQALELFLILRRMGKPSWLLEYGGSANHGLFDRRQAIDFSRRMFQFFNYYLKNKPEPNWMKYGIKAKNATRETGLGYDNNKNI
jgi:dienelactone hydrolase